MSQMTKKNAILVVVTGVLFLAASVFCWIRTVRYRGEGVHADAEIVDIETTYFDEDADHEVTVRFITDDGVTVTGKLDAYKTGFYVGKTVPVLYLPNDPEKFTYEQNGLLLPLILGGVGVFLVAAGLFGLLRKKRDDDGADPT